MPRVLNKRDRTNELRLVVLLVSIVLTSGFIWFLYRAPDDFNWEYCLTDRLVVAPIYIPFLPVREIAEAEALPAFIPAPSSTFSILFAGDTMLDRGVRQRSGSNLYYPFEHFRSEDGISFRGQDYVVLNLEGAITAVRRPPEKSYDFAFDPAYAGILAEIGVDAVTLANNHSFDQGTAGFLDTERALEAAGVEWFHDSHTGGIAPRIAYLGEAADRIALVGLNASAGTYDASRAEDLLAEALLHASHTIAYVHWGNEYESSPNAQQRTIAHRLVDLGADAVIGAHPHVVQPMEIYRGVPIVYSLGNFVFDQDFSSKTTEGLAVKLTFSEEGDSLELFPLSIIRSQPKFLSGAERDAKLEALADLSDASLRNQIRTGMIRL
jgi:hypothetical protein